MARPQTHSVMANETTYLPPEQTSISVLVVDDSSVYRRLLTLALKGLPDVQLSGLAGNGLEALTQLGALRRDLVLLDVEMPELGGLETLKEIRRRWPDVEVIMVSATSTRSAELTMNALECGALAFVPKPVGDDLNRSLAKIRNDFRPLIEICKVRKNNRETQKQKTMSREPQKFYPGELRPMHTPVPSRATISQPPQNSGLFYVPAVSRPPSELQSAAPATYSSPASSVPPQALDSAHSFPRITVPPQALDSGHSFPRISVPPAPSRPPSPNNELTQLISQYNSSFSSQPSRPPRFVLAQRPPLIAIGASTGGPKALLELFSALPGPLPVPVVVAQHMPATFTPSFAALLQRRTGLSVVEARDGEILLPHQIYIAPGDRDMRVLRSADNEDLIVRIVPPPDDQKCHPSVDALFCSIAQIPLNGVLSVVMTGVGDDGLQGVRMLDHRGSHNLIQSADSCAIFGMPKAIADAGLDDARLSPAHLARRMVEIFRGS